MDQAEGLRTLMEPSEGTRVPPPSPGLGEETPSREKWPRVIAVSSGKGGVGKTNVVANLAFALTRLGEKVLVWDADLSLANLDILLGLTPRYTIEHFLNRKKGLREILVEGPGGMTILPASSGVQELADLSCGDIQECGEWNFVFETFGRTEEEEQGFEADGQSAGAGQKETRQQAALPERKILPT